MKLLQSACVLVLFTGIAAIFAQPNIVPSLSEQSSRSWSDIYKGQAACNVKYTNEQQFINEQIVMQTTACNTEAGKSTTNHSDAQIDSQINMARNNLTTLETNLTNCSSISDNLGFAKCVNNNVSEQSSGAVGGSLLASTNRVSQILRHNGNQNLLNNAYASTQYAENLFDDSEQNANGRQASCIAHVMQAASRNFTSSTQDYNQCMNAVFSSLHRGCPTNGSVILCT